MPVPQTERHVAAASVRESDRLLKLGRALIAMTKDLAGCRREIASLERENAELRRRAERGR